MAQPGALGPDLERLYQRSLDCVHCGLCLTACPTYRATGRENSSPRGRVYLLRGVAEGRVPLQGVVTDEAYLCLGCRACETACPSGVRFGSMLDLARAEVERHGLRPGLARRLEGFALRWILPRPGRLRALVSLLAAVQRLRLDRLARPFLPRRLRELQESVPEIPSRAERRPLPALVPAEGRRRGRVGLFVGCVMPELFGAVNAATARLLARNGFDVAVPAAQGCCGALQAHGGQLQLARDLALRNVRAFASAGVDALVTNSAGCGAALCEAGEWLPGEGEALASSVRDVTEFLDEAGLEPPSVEIRARVCYDDPCHLVHGQRVEAAPRRLLQAIPGLTLVPHDDPGGCCGAAGIYHLTQPAMSRTVLDRKMEALAAADPDLIASGNPGCLLQLRVGVRRHGLRARVVHPVELLDSAYGGESRRR